MLLNITGISGTGGHINFQKSLGGVDDLRNSHFVVASSFLSSPPSNEVISSESDYVSSSSPHLLSRNNLLLTFSHQYTSHFTNLSTLRESPNCLLSPFLNFLTRLIFLWRNLSLPSLSYFIFFSVEFVEKFYFFFFIMAARSGFR